ncbi:protein of unknown function [Methanoculleus bourgensis]|uniref:Uncharacterized protein n=1 Tax=Methanoculleus bourgensis TaxID=83986 RepID=A0A0X3BKV6_9EURY|nr:protein of unknown function [Methanoculleus bourgensis]
MMDAIGGALQRQGKSLIVCLDDANLLHYNNMLGRCHQHPAPAAPGLSRRPGRGLRDGQRHGP